MKIISMIDELQSQHVEHITIRKNGTILINVGTIPKAQHMLFEGLTVLGQFRECDKEIRSNTKWKIIREAIFHYEQHKMARNIQEFL